MVAGNSARRGPRSIEVLALAAGGGHRTLLTAPSTVRSIDIAGTVIATGRTRPGHPPRHGPLTVLVLVLVAAGVVTLGWFVRRLRAKRRISA